MFGETEARVDPGPNWDTRPRRGKFPTRSNPIRRPETGNVIRMWKCGAGARTREGSVYASENLEPNRQILLRILSDRLNQASRFQQQLISIVVHGGIAQKFACRAFACFQPVGDG